MSTIVCAHLPFHFQIFSRRLLNGFWIKNVSFPCQVLFLKVWFNLYIWGAVTEFRSFLAGFKLWIHFADSNNVVSLLLLWIKFFLEYLHIDIKPFVTPIVCAINIIKCWRSTVVFQGHAYRDLDLRLNAVKP